MKTNYLKTILHNKFSIIGSIITIILMIFIGLKYINIQELTVNFNQTYAIIEIILHIFLTIGLTTLVALFLAKPTYKKPSSILGGISGFLGAIIVGCPICSITLMSTLGLVSFFGTLPRFGLEIKLLSFFLVSRSIDYEIRHFNSCSKGFFKGLFPPLKKTIISIIIFTSIFFGISYLLKQAERIKIPEYKIKILFPKNYSIFWYNLNEGCSDTDTFREFYGKDRNFMLKNLKIYSYSGTLNFNKCLTKNKININGITSDIFQQKIDLRSTNSGIIINNNKFIYQKNNCKNNICNIDIRTIKNNNLLQITAKYKNNLIKNLDKNIYNSLINLYIKDI